VFRLNWNKKKTTEKSVETLIILIPYWFFSSLGRYLKLKGLAFVLETFTCNLTNPHGLKAITKLTASGWKEPLIHHPLHSNVRGAGCCLCRLEDLLNKNVSCTKLLSKAHWKLQFYFKCQTKKIADNFARHFLIFKNDLLRASCKYCIYNGSATWYTTHC
jgi:hypothetical protein